MTQERTRPVQTGTQGRGLFVGIGVFVALGLAGWVAILAVESTEVVEAPPADPPAAVPSTTLGTGDHRPSMKQPLPHGGRPTGSPLPQPTGDAFRCEIP